MGDQLRIDVDDGVREWEVGLPSVNELASLSVSLVPADLASAFRILPELPRTAGDVSCASQSTLSSLREVNPVGDRVDDCEVYELEPQEGSDPKKSRLMGPIDEEAGGDCVDDQSMEVEEKAVKKSRLVWTPQLHKRFVEVVAHLGLKNAVPKTIMELMNVEGLTRENVASHLQKYRLYVKRQQGWSNEGSSPSDHLSASNEVTSNGVGSIRGNGNENRLQNSCETGNQETSNGRLPIQMPYPLPPHFTHVPTMAVAAENVSYGYHGIQQQHDNMMTMMMQQQHNNMMMMQQQQQQHNNNMMMMQQQQQRDWAGSMYSSHPYHAVDLNKK